MSSPQREANKTLLSFLSSAKQDTSFDFYFDQTANREREGKKGATHIPPVVYVFFFSNKEKKKEGYTQCSCCVSFRRRLCEAYRSSFQVDTHSVVFWKRGGHWQHMCLGADVSSLMRGADSSTQKRRNSLARKVSPVQMTTSFDVWLYVQQKLRHSSESSVWLGWLWKTHVATFRLDREKLVGLYGF